LFIYLQGTSIHFTTSLILFRHHFSVGAGGEHLAACWSLRDHVLVFGKAGQGWRYIKRRRTGAQFVVSWCFSLLPVLEAERGHEMETSLKGTRRGEGRELDLRTFAVYTYLAMCNLSSDSCISS
jgi:hypothetical protein